VPNAPPAAVVNPEAVVIPTGREVPDRPLAGVAAAFVALVIAVEPMAATI
jgi:uncharacterized protein